MTRVLSPRLKGEGDGVYCLRWFPRDAREVWYRLRMEAGDARRLAALLKAAPGVIRPQQFGQLLGWGYGTPPKS
jgi:hypothetical protein